MATLSRRSDPQTSKRAEVQDRVLAATEALLGEEISFADLKVEQIATRAGISRPAFYFYFRDKRELLMRLTEDVTELLLAQADDWWSSEGDGRLVLPDALGRVMGLYREHGVLLRAVVEASAYDTVVAEFWRAILGRFIESTRDRIESEHAAGVATALPAQETAFALCWMTERACYQRLVRGGDIAAPDFAAALAGIWVAAIYGDES